jgi:hypothetical protein
MNNIRDVILKAGEMSAGFESVQLNCPVHIFVPFITLITLIYIPIARKIFLFFYR